MILSSSSAAGVRFLAAIKYGHGLKPSAREAGIGKAVGSRWLREKYVQLRRDGKTAAELGFTTSCLPEWEAAAFWVSFDRGDSLETAVREAGVAPLIASRHTQLRAVICRRRNATDINKATTRFPP